MEAYKLFPFFRQSIWVCRRLCCQQRCSSGHSALLCRWIHLHNCFAPNGAGWSPGVCPDPKERRRSGAPKSSPEERETHEAAAHGQGLTCGQLPQPYHPHPGKNDELTAPISTLFIKYQQSAFLRVLICRKCDYNIRKSFKE